MRNKWHRVASLPAIKHPLKGKALGHIEPNPESDEDGNWNRLSEVSIQYHKDNRHEWVQKNMRAPAMYQVPVSMRYGPDEYLYILTEDEVRYALTVTGVWTSEEIENIVNYTPREQGMLEEIVVTVFVAGVALAYATRVLQVGAIIIGLPIMAAEKVGLIKIAKAK